MQIRTIFASFLAIAFIFIATGLLAQEDESAVPGPPRQVKVSIAGNAAQIQWEPPDENPEAVTGYEIVRAHAPNGLYRKIVHVPRNVLTYRDDTIRLNLRYFYKVRAQADDFYSDYSNPASAETPEARNQN